MRLRFQALEERIVLDAAVGDALTPGGDINGRAWYDSNADGFEDPGEAAQADVTVNLYDSSDSLIASTTTDALGEYCFEDVDPGDYRLEFISDPSHNLTWQNLGSDDTIDSDANRTTGFTELFSLADAQVINDMDAGFAGTSSSSIAGRLWDDNDDFDGLDNLDPLALSGRIVELMDAAGTTVLDTAVTDSLGEYSFSSLVDGTYQIRFTPSITEVLTYQNVGSDDTIDSDLDRDTFLSGTIALASSTVTDIDAGVVSTSNLAGISGSFWTDTNRNGIRDAGEPAAPENIIRLRDAAGNHLDSISFLPCIAISDHLLVLSF